MAPLTWRNVDAPSFAGSNQLLADAAKSFNTGMEASLKTLDAFQGSQITRDSNQYALDIMKFQDPAAYRAALANGTVPAPDARNLTPEAINFAANYEKSLIGNQQAGANLTSTGLNNTAQAFNNQQGVEAAARAEAIRAATPAAQARQAEIRALVDTGDPAKLAEARKLQAESVGMFTAAGIDPLAVMSDTNASFNSSMGQTQSLVAYDDFWKDRNTNESSEALVQDIIKNTTNPEEAIRGAQIAAQKGYISPEVLRSVTADISANGATYYPTIAQTPWDAVLNPNGAPTAASIPSYIPGGPASPSLQGITYTEAGKPRDPDNGYLLSESDPRYAAAVAASPVNAPSSNAAPAVGGAGTSAGVASLIENESGGNWNALNSEGYGGRLQFGTDRLADAAKAGLVPAGTTGAEFSRMSPAQQQAVEVWHFNDIDNQAKNAGLDKYYGQVINGVTINPDSIRAMSHIGGFGGAQKFIESNGQYNPEDSNGTSLRDYGIKHNKFNGSAPYPEYQTPTGFSPYVGMAQAKPSENIFTTKVGDNWVNIPLTVQGNPVSETEAVELYKSGQNPSTGDYDTKEEATQASNMLDEAANTVVAPPTSVVSTVPTSQSATAPTPAQELAAAVVPTNTTTPTAIQQQQTITNSAGLNNAFNTNAAVNAEIANPPNPTEKLPSVIKRLSEETGVPATAMTAAINEIIATHRVSPAVAGVLAANALEARDLGGAWGPLGLIPGMGPGDQYGGATEGRTAPRINMESVAATIEGYRNGGDISEGVAQITQQQNSSQVAVKADQVVAAITALDQWFAQQQAAALINPRAVNIEAITLQYQANRAALQAKLASVGGDPSSTNYVTATTPPQ